MNKKEKSNFKNTEDIIMLMQGKKVTPFYVAVTFLLTAGVIISILFAVTFGSVKISVQDVYSVILYKLFHFESLSAYAKGPVHDVVWLIRLPRLFLAVAVGGGLSVCGIVMQAIVKNPLADPYILGISSGASLGATMAIMLGIGAFFGVNFIGVTASAGAFFASILVVTIANIGSRANSVKLLLAGTAISSVCSSFSSFIVYFANDKEGMQTITFWLMGSLAGAKWYSNAVVFSVILMGIIFFITQYRNLNMMLLGDEVSITLGTDLHKYRIFYLLITSIMIGFIVYSAGMIGFVGLIIPHIVRIFFGTDHKKIIPISALTGAILLIWTDVFSRILIPNTELPIGILISMIGAPCFIYLLVKKSYGFGGGS